MSDLRIFVELSLATAALFAWSFALGAVIRRVVAEPALALPAIEAPGGVAVAAQRGRQTRPFRPGERVVAGVRFSSAARQRRGLRAHAVW